MKSQLAADNLGGKKNHAANTYVSTMGVMRIKLPGGHGSGPGSKMLGRGSTRDDRGSGAERWL